jgi:hypothetical protein
MQSCAKVYFSVQELEFLFAGYKHNGKRITRNEFPMLIAAFDTTLSDDVFAKEVFDLFDTDHECVQLSRVLFIV